MIRNCISYPNNKLSPYTPLKQRLFVFICLTKCSMKAHQPQHCSKRIKRINFTLIQTRHTAQ